MPRRRRLAFIGVILAIQGIALEAASYVVVRTLVRRDAVFHPTIPPSPERYLIERDPILGWPAHASFGTKQLDSSGARLLPAFPKTGNACVSAYGDSFVFGDEVDNESAWTNQLALKLGCRVANYGVNGYGTDQAYLRFKSMASDEAPVVILGYFSNDIIRNINQLRNLIGPTNGIGLKPRFILGPSGELQLVPLATLPPEHLKDVVASPGKFLPHEYFVPGGPSGLVSDSFPYVLTLGRALRSYKVHAVLRRESPYAEFYRHDHPSRALQIAEQICRAFADHAVARGKRPLIVFFPSEGDLQAAHKGSRWLYQPLVDALERAGQPLVNVGPALLARLNGRNPHALFGIVHYKEEGNIAVAEAVHEALTRQTSR